MTPDISFMGHVLLWLGFAFLIFYGSCWVFALIFPIFLCLTAVFEKKPRPTKLVRISVAEIENTGEWIAWTPDYGVTTKGLTQQEALDSAKKAVHILLNKFGKGEWRLIEDD